MAAVDEAIANPMLHDWQNESESEIFYREVKEVGSGSTNAVVESNREATQGTDAGGDAEKNISKTFFNCYEVELDISYDGDDLVSNCWIVKGNYGASLAKADAEGTLDDSRTGEEILIPDRVVSCIRKWAEDNGY